jgi:hypothetical protein
MNVTLNCPGLEYSALGKIEEGSTVGDIADSLIGKFPEKKGQIFRFITNGVFIPEDTLIKDVIEEHQPNSVEFYISILFPMKFIYDDGREFNLEVNGKDTLSKISEIIIQKENLDRNPKLFFYFLDDEKEIDLFRSVEEIISPNHIIQATRRNKNSKIKKLNVNKEDTSMNSDTVSKPKDGDLEQISTEESILLDMFLELGFDFESIVNALKETHDHDRILDILVNSPQRTITTQLITDTPHLSKDKMDFDTNNTALNETFSIIFDGYLNTRDKEWLINPREKLLALGFSATYAPQIMNANRFFNIDSISFDDLERLNLFAERYPLLELIRLYRKHGNSTSEIEKYL